LAEAELEAMLEAATTELVALILQSDLLLHQLEAEVV
jgi:hypothetical protein